MKRIQSACLSQTIHFQLKEDTGHAQAVSLGKAEYENYKRLLDRNGTPAALYFLLSQLPVHGRGLVLLCQGFHRQYLYFDDPLAKADLQHVTGLHVVGGLHRPPVGGDPGVVAGLVRHRAPLNKPGDLEPFV